MAVSSAGGPTIYQVDETPVPAPPPRVQFGAWTVESEDEFQIEKRLVFASAVNSGYPENDRVRVRLFEPNGFRGALPVVILLNYWGASDDQLEESLARRLNARGMAALILPLPYHLSRTPRGYGSGQLAIQPDPNAMKSTMVQALQDVRRTVDLIETVPELDRTRIGVAGTSLGSIVGSLAFALDARISAASFVLGGVDLAHIIWRSSVVAQQRERLRSRGWTEEKLSQELKSIEPGEFLKPLGERKALVVWARHDQVIPKESSLELIKKLDTPAVISLESGHYGGFLIQGEILRVVSSFFDASFRGMTYTPPAGLSAPTIRVGMTYNQETGFQVAAGIDVWRGSGGWHATPMLTPKGVQGFIGFEAGGQFSLGASITSHRTVLGICWTVIL